MNYHNPQIQRCKVAEYHHVTKDRNANFFPSIEIVQLLSEVRHGSEGDSAGRNRYLILFLILPHFCWYVPLGESASRQQRIVRERSEGTVEVVSRSTEKQGDPTSQPSAHVHPYRGPRLFGPYLALLLKSPNISARRGFKPSPDKPSWERKRRIPRHYRELFSAYAEQWGSLRSIRILSN